MDEVGAAGDAAERARVSRRRALKAGAALGVGVTAWAGPQIGRMGATPAYAAACTVPFSFVSRSNCKNSSCPTECDNGVKYIKLGPLTVSGTVNGGTVSAEVPAIGTSNACAGPKNRGQATLSVPNTTGQCRLNVEVWEGKNECKDRAPASALVGSAPTLAVLGGTTGDVDLPDVPCGSFAASSNLFFSLTIQCTTSTDPNCF